MFAGDRKIGLVLSGGAAHGLAHIGVLKVVERLGLPIHCVTGASMGAAVGILWAAGHSAAELEETVLHLPRRHALTPVVSRYSLFRSPLAEHLLQDWLDTKTFADLRLPVTVTAVDEATLQEVRLSEGSLMDAVAASAAVPALMPPRRVDGRWLIDGSVINNIPVDVAREMGAEYVIAVDVVFGDHDAPGAPAPDLPTSDPAGLPGGAAAADGAAGGERGPAAAPGPVRVQLPGLWPRAGDYGGGRARGGGEAGGGVGVRRRRRFTMYDG